MRLKNYGGWIALAVLVTACASPAPSPVVARTAAGPGAPTGPSVEDRIAKLERIISSHSLAGVIQQIEILQRDTGKLQGNVELQTHELEGAQKRQRDLYLDTDRRLQALEIALNTLTIKLNALETQAIQAPTPEPAAAPDDGVPAAQGEEHDYQQALEAIRDGKNEDAVARFQEYLKRYPSGQLRDNAYYWLGEAYLALQKPKQALEPLNSLIAQFPKSEKSADAQLKIGYAHYDLKEWTKAKGALDAVRKKYPDSAAARLADKRLKQLKLEGH
ncbi:MAG: tol-pal system protein YbgF [Pseudomonadota bacterium]